jgi:hypothetical protein
MSQFQRVAFAIATLVAFAMFTPASHAAPVPPGAGKAVTFPYPAKAPVVVQVNGLTATRDRFRTMLKAALPDEAANVDQQIDDGLKLLLADRKLSAIPKDGRVFFVVHDIAALFDNTLAISVLVPVTSYKEFRETFLTEDERKTFEAGKKGVDEVKMTFFGNEHTIHMVDLKEYVALCPDKNTIETYTNKYTRATTAAMAPELAKTFVTADLSVYVNFEVINNLYGEQIRAFKGLIDLAFMQAPMGGIPGLGKKQLETAKVMLKGLFQAAEDCHGLVLGLEFRPEGANLRLQAQFAEDTDSVKLLNSELPGPLVEVSKLPAGLGQYSGTKLGKKLSETMSGLSPQFVPADDDEKGNTAIEKFQKGLLAAGPRSEISASGTPDVSLTIGTYSDAKKAVAALVGCYETMVPGGRIQSVVLKEKPKIEAGARKHQSFTFTEVRLVFDFDATAKDLPDELKEKMLTQLKRLVTEKMTVWVGTDGTSVVQVSAKDWDAARVEIDKYLDGQKVIGETAGYKLTRKNLPPDASFLMLLETGHTANMLLESLQAVAGVIPDFPKIGKVKPVKGEPAFIGIAITLKGDTATFNLFVPGTAIAAGHGILRDLLKKVE